MQPCAPCYSERCRPLSNGPRFSRFEKVKGFLEDARQNGKIVAVGGVLEREGYFVQPTIWLRNGPSFCKVGHFSHGFQGYSGRLADEESSVIFNHVLFRFFRLPRRRIGAKLSQDGLPSSRFAPRHCP